MLIVFAMATTAFFQTRKVSKRNQMDVEILQNARIGANEMARILKMIGYRRDKERGQVALIEAAPFQIIFNADIYKNKSTLTPWVYVNLYDGTEYEAPMHNYTPYAETIRLTLDSDDNGIVDDNDTNDNNEEKDTRNPNDMVLIEEILHSANPSRWRDRAVTLGVRGPYDFEGQPSDVAPMFQYWLLNPDKSFSLLGDDDNDGVLEGDERYFRSITSQQILRNVRRIQITLTVESDHPDPFNPTIHRQVSLNTKINLRNME